MNAFMHATLGITDFWTFLLGTIFIVLLPGPNSMYVLSIAAQRGIRAGYRGACGVFLGDAILMVLSAAGVASLLKASPGLFHVVKYVGAGYLAWIGLQMLRGAVRAWLRRAEAVDAGAAEAAQVPAAASPSPFRKALVISLLNPKAILFFISFFIQFVDPQFGYPALSFVALGLVCQVCSFAYLTTIILVGARLADAFRRRRRLSAGMTSGVGAMFLGFSAKLATATLN
ncbi:leucine efflux protein LeuE [Cupriavidus plantarum]|uniref:leucine efflux protein LeuE n=1 Tax=Cupriavidus plantarum TaxID=942865 RepID=UPI000E24ABAB|nr:leucine efflux protein LeuE [Cupriavidus plantarum]NYH99660.1 leucine efflux protein [Cupriavidus plantarum]REF02399.1 RhtB (resistance to homoserine/threonine) family protein [Cupriavidus plantarum]RLK44745.1 RhtB (resistance to homoserine/threonine) family protein [Cupriavidus plantarum]CAG2152904.1 Leucine efflux protein [Cupriavidus plantarum]SMR65944.1 leucine efflux protein [Cupriavidus plantarum]